MSIKKYTAGTYNNDVHMFETEYGKYVKLEDHEEIVNLLQKEIDDLEYEIRNYKALWG